MSDQITGSLSFIMLENSLEEKTPKSFQKDMKQLIGLNNKKTNFDKSIIFRKNKVSRMWSSQHSNPESFFNKIKSRINSSKVPGIKSGKVSTRQSFVIKGSQVFAKKGTNKPGKRKRRKKSKLVVNSLDLSMLKRNGNKKSFFNKNNKNKAEGKKGRRAAKNSVKTSEGSGIGFVKSKRREKCMLPIITINGDGRKNIMKNNVTSTTDSDNQVNIVTNMVLNEAKAEESQKEAPKETKLVDINLKKSQVSTNSNTGNKPGDETGRSIGRVGMFTLKADKVLEKKKAFGYRYDHCDDEDEENELNDSNRAQKPESAKDSPFPAQKKNGATILLPFNLAGDKVSSSLEAVNKKAEKLRIRHKPSRSCLINSGFKVDEEQLIKPKTMVNIDSPLIPLHFLEEEDDKRLYAVRNYKEELQKSKHYEPFARKSSSCHKNVQWKLTREQLMREGKVQRKKRGSPSAKTRRNQMTKKQLELIEVENEIFPEVKKEDQCLDQAADGGKVGRVSHRRNQAVLNFNQLSEEAIEQPSIRRQGKKRRGKSGGFGGFGGFQSMV